MIDSTKRYILKYFKIFVRYILDTRVFLFTIASLLVFYIIVSLKDTGSVDVFYIKKYFLDSSALQYLTKSIVNLNVIRIFSYLLNTFLILLSVLHLCNYIPRIFKFTPGKFILSKYYAFVVLIKRLKSDRWCLIFSTFFIFIIVYSFFVYRDFGISIDEKVQYRHLLITGKKIYTTLGILENAPENLKGAEEFDSYDHKYYGVSAQIPLLFLENFSDKLDFTTPLFWEIRHMYVRLFFIIAGFCFYSLLRFVIKSNLVLLTGLVLFFFHPRISAHSFYNIKDSLFLSFFTICTYFMFKYMKTSRLKNLIFFAVITAFTINIRLIGAFIPIYFFLYILITNRGEFKLALKTLLIYSFYTTLTLYIIWPVLWSKPSIEMYNAFKTFSNYTKWDGTVLFMGKVLKATELPATYVPVWIIITSPIHYLITYVIGFLLLLYSFLKRRRNGAVYNLLLFSTFILLSTYGSVIIFNSTLYDDWRHLYYIFPALIIPGILGLDSISRSKKTLFLVVLFVFCISLINTSTWMVRNHPHHYVYFNFLAGRNWDQKWDRDYWFLSSKQILEKLLSHNNSQDNQKKLIICANYHVSYNQYIIPLEKREKLVFVNSQKECDYAIGDYRYILEDYKEEDFPGFYEFTSVRVGGKKIMTLFKKE